MSIRTIFNKLKQSGELSRFDYAVTQGKISRVVKQFIEDKKLIVHGAKAQNAQSHFPLTRATRDYDIFTRGNPRLTARELEILLDKARGGNYHYTKKGLHKGTHKVRDVGVDLKRGTEDDFTLADVTKLVGKLKTIRKNNISYSHLDELEKRKLASLRSKQFAFRHQKDKADLMIIQRLKRGGFWI